MPSNKRATATIAFIVINCLLFAWTVNAQQKESQEVRTKLFNKVLNDYKDLRECYEQEEGGLRAAQENMNVEQFDLNRDGVLPGSDLHVGGGAQLVPLGE